MLGVFHVNVIKGGSGYFTILPKQYARRDILVQRPGDQGRFVFEKGTVLQEGYWTLTANRSRAYGSTPG